MKNQLLKPLLSAFLLLLICSTAQAQKTVVKLNPLSLIFITGNVAVEHALSNSSSIQLGLAYSGFKLGDGDVKTSYNGFSIVPEYRLYLLKEQDAPEGLFIGPVGIFRSWTTKQTVAGFSNGINKSNLLIFGGGLNVGYQLVLDSGFTLEFFGGPCYAGSITKAKDGGGNVEVATTNIAGFGTRAGMTLGWAF